MCEGYLSVVGDVDGGSCIGRKIRGGVVWHAVRSDESGSVRPEEGRGGWLAEEEVDGEGPVESGFVDEDADEVLVVVCGVWMGGCRIVVFSSVVGIASTECFGWSARGCARG